MTERPLDLMLPDVAGVLVVRAPDGRTVRVRGRLVNQRVRLGTWELDDSLPMDQQKDAYYDAMDSEWAAVQEKASRAPFGNWSALSARFRVGLRRLPEYLVSERQRQRRQRAGRKRKPPLSNAERQRRFRERQRQLRNANDA
jgi:hypothetical protein